jgi:hypothetical protein
MGISKNMQPPHGHLISEIQPDWPGRLTEPCRLRFWEIEDFFKCPVIGWCLDIAEQREILRKEGICIKGNSDFETHALVVESLESENPLSRKIDRRLNRKYKKEMGKSTEQAPSSNRHPEQSLPLDLSRMHILIVGGLPKMEFLYRRLIEENGGIFDYHNGQVRGGTKELEHQVIRADVVLCPIDHNSHAAALAAKRFGKKHGKPVRMLPNSSLSTISQALQAVF